MTIVIDDVTHRRLAYISRATGRKINLLLDEAVQCLLDKYPSSSLSISGLLREDGKTESEVRSLRPTNNIVHTRPETELQKPDNKPVVPNIRELGLDSVAMAHLVCKMTNEKRISFVSGKCALILYELYIHFLKEKHMRIFAEVPRVWKFGPMFPRVYRHFSEGCDAKKMEQLETNAIYLRDNYPEITDKLSRLIDKYADTLLYDMQLYYTRKGSIFQAAKLQSGKNWNNSVIDDHTVFQQTS